MCGQGTKRWVQQLQLTCSDVSMAAAPDSLCIHLTVALIWAPRICSSIVHFARPCTMTHTCAGWQQGMSSSWTCAGDQGVKL